MHTNVVMRRLIATYGRGALALAAVVLLAPSLQAQTASPPAFAIEAADHSVVLISVTYRASNGRTARGVGSGVIVDANGLILTAAHVVSRANTVQVHLRSGEVLPAEVVGTDRVYDLALVRVNSERLLPAAVLGASSLLQRGETVVALGRAPRRQAGPTAGIFLEVNLERSGVPDIVSTAVAYPGDSGGALVNERGEVVGIIVAITGDGLVSLARASDAVRTILVDLRVGDVRHPWLGIRGPTLTEDLAAQLGLMVHSGVLIVEVLPNSPASLAGLRGAKPSSTAEFPAGGDVIVGVDGRPVTTFGALAAYILSRHIGDTITLEINRDGHVFTTTVVLGERPTL